MGGLRVLISGIDPSPSGFYTDFVRCLIADTRKRATLKRARGVGESMRM